jgi:hypothetical protein
MWGWPFELTGEEGKKKFLTEEQYQSIIDKLKAHL